jgi:hypothetical protein
MRKECPQILKEEKKIGEALQKSRNQVEPQDSGNSVVQYLRNPLCTGSGGTRGGTPGRPSLAPCSAPALATHVLRCGGNCQPMVEYVQLPTVMKHSTTTKCINSNNINTLISVHIRSTVQCQKQIGT